MGSDFIDRAGVPNPDPGSRPIHGASNLQLDLEVKCVNSDTRPAKVAAPFDSSKPLPTLQATLLFFTLRYKRGVHVDGDRRISDDISGKGGRESSRLPLQFH